MGFRSRNLMIELLVVLLILFIACSKKVDNEHEIIAKVGNRIIDWDYLKRDFELNPKWGRGLTYREAYSNQLNYLVDQKLYALAAIGEGMNQDSSIADYLTFIHEKEMIKELYRQVVAKKIEITDEEYQDAYGKLKKQVQLNYVFTTDYKHAQKYSQELKSSNLEDIQLVNPIQEHKGTTRMMSFGDMKPELENMVFGLKQNEVSDPVSVNDGYMVVQVASGEVEKFTSELDFAESKSKIKKVIFDRRASKTANTYIKDLMLDKELKLNPPIFFELSKQCSQIIQDKYSDNPFPININNQEIKTAQDNLTSIKDEILITYRDGQMTVGEFLSKLARMPIGLRPKVKMASQLKDAIGVIVRNEYLVKEAKKMGLDNDEIVRQETEIQSDEILARYWLNKQKEMLHVSEEEINEFKNSDSFERLLGKLPDRPTDKQLDDIILDLKMAQLKMNLSDSLRALFNVQIDTTKLQSKIKNPMDVIKYNPAKMVVRELFY
jgi:hypothetical protein